MCILKIVCFGLAALLLCNEHIILDNEIKELLNNQTVKQELIKQIEVQNAKILFKDLAAIVNSENF